MLRVSPRRVPAVLTAVVMLPTKLLTLMLEVRKSVTLCALLLPKNGRQQVR